MRKVLLTLLVVVLVLAGLGAAGFAGYRYGYAQAVQTASNGDAQQTRPGFGFGLHRMPMHGFGLDRGFGRGVERGFGIMPGMMGFGVFGPLLFLARIAFWALVIWAIYMLVTRSGWRLTRTTQTVEPPAASTTTEVTEVKE